MAEGPQPAAPEPAPATRLSADHGGNAAVSPVAPATSGAGSAESSAGARRASSPQRSRPRWVNVTQTVRDGAASLGVGELLMARGFTLYNALSAIEIMDPKMDIYAPKAADIPQFLSNGDSDLEAPMAGMSITTTASPTRASSRSSPYDENLAQLLVDTLDHIFIREVAWMNGALLFQTIFAIYSCQGGYGTDALEPSASQLEELLPLEEAYTTALIQTTSYAVDIIHAARVFGEDDIALSPEPYFHMHAPHQSTEAEWTEYMDYLAEARIVATELSHRLDEQKYCGDRALIGAGDDQLADALGQRYLFREQLLNALHKLWTLIHMGPEINKLAQVGKDIGGIIESARSALTTITALPGFDKDNPSPVFIDPSSNRELFTDMPPRAIDLPDMERAREHWMSTFRDLAWVVREVLSPDSATFTVQCEKYMTYLEERHARFAARQPGLLARSVYYLLHTHVLFPALASLLEDVTEWSLNSAKLETEVHLWCLSPSMRFRVLRKRCKHEHMPNQSTSNDTTRERRPGPRVAHAIDACRALQCALETDLFAAWEMPWVFTVLVRLAACVRVSSEAGENAAAMHVIREAPLWELFKDTAALVLPARECVHASDAWFEQRFGFVGDVGSRNDVWADVLAVSDGVTHSDVRERWEDILRSAEPAGAGGLEEEGVARDMVTVLEKLEKPVKGKAVVRWEKTTHITYPVLTIDYVRDQP